MRDIPKRRRRHRGSQTIFDSSVITFDSFSGLDSDSRGSKSLANSDSGDEEKEDLSPNYLQEDFEGDSDAYGRCSP